MVELTDFDDSTEHLYDVIAANDDIPEEEVRQLLRGIVAENVRQIFNNQEGFAERFNQPDVPADETEDE